MVLFVLWVFLSRSFYNSNLRAHLFSYDFEPEVNTDADVIAQQRRVLIPVSRPAIVDGIKDFYRLKPELAELVRYFSGGEEESIGTTN